MEMEIIVQAVTKQSKQAQGKTYWGVKAGDGNWYNLIRDAKPANGDRYSVDVKETEFKGRVYRWATIVQAQSAAPDQRANQSPNNGHISWEDYQSMARLAHELAMEMEPDETGAESHFEDRSQARASIMNTILRDYANGRIALPKEDPLPPADDDIPF